MSAAPTPAAAQASGLNQMSQRSGVRWLSHLGRHANEQTTHFMILTIATIAVRHFGASPLEAYDFLWWCKFRRGIMTQGVARFDRMYRNADAAHHPAILHAVGWGSMRGRVQAIALAYGYWLGYHGRARLDIRAQIVAARERSAPRLQHRVLRGTGRAVTNLVSPTNTRSQNNTRRWNNPNR